MSDLISRQDAIDVIMGEPTDAHYPSWYADKIKSLPSTDRPTGEWKKIDTWKYCSECGWTIYAEDDRAYNYCPHCGTRMRGEEE